MPTLNVRCHLFVLACCFISACATAQEVVEVEDVFEADHRNGLVMQVEAAIASAQADYGVISRDAADEITRTANTQYASLEEIDAEYEIVRHRMVALLNVWKRSLSPEAADSLHLGVTTVDVYDTVLLLQLLESIDMMLAELLAIEQELACLATQHRDTVMIGRTLGQHALPITFGKKVSVWAAQTRRNIDRLYEVRARLRSSGVLKGAVGSYAGLGESAMDVERSVSSSLGLATPEPADWRPARDVFAEYAQTLALISKAHAGIGREIFHLQMTDIGEVYERRQATAVGSSTMPHKRNPSLSEALIFYGRTIPAAADVVLQDVESVFERDNTSRPNRALMDITVDAAIMLKQTKTLLNRLEVNEQRMLANVDRTDGMVMSQKVMLFLANKISKEVAEKHVRAAADVSLGSEISFKDALLSDPLLRSHLEAQIDELLEPENSLGMAGEQVDATIDWINTKRLSLNQKPLQDCK